MQKITRLAAAGELDNPGGQLVNQTEEEEETEELIQPPRLPIEPMYKK